MPRRLLSPSLAALLALVSSLALVGSAAAAPPRGEGHEGPVRSADDELVLMGREIPGFGGLYYDEQGRPNVYLLDPAGAGSVAVKSLGAGVLVHRGDFEFERLLNWRLKLRPLLALPGVVSLDADESRNRVVIGVDASSRTKSLDRERLELGLLSADVPREAVVLEETARIEELVGLRDKLRPVPGGSQILFNGIFVCTLGFNAFRGNDFGFVINGHCTGVRGEVDGMRYVEGQPSSGAIGTEIADPGFSTGGPCPVGRRCRFSDSAFAKYDNPRLGVLGGIARPLSGGSEIGSVSLKNPATRFAVTGRVGSPLVGDVVHKVGRTTGWTYGTVYATCADVNNGGTDITQFCQSRVRGGGGPGDSGSPVFYVLPKNKAKLVGILWGGSTDPSLGTVYVFSPLENIEAELGPLRIN